MRRIFTFFIKISSSLVPYTFGIAFSIWLQICRDISNEKSTLAIMMRKVSKTAVGNPCFKPLYKPFGTSKYVPGFIFSRIVWKAGGAL
jgi:hypothetical protein